MPRRRPFLYFGAPAGIIGLVEMLDIRFQLSLRIVEDFLHEPGSR